MKFEDIRIEAPGRSNQSPIEVVLFDGIKPDTQASSAPYAWVGDKKSDNPGLVLVGYALKITSDKLMMTPDRIQVPGSSTQVGGWGIGREAIHSIRRLQYV